MIPQEILVDFIDELAEMEGNRTVFHSMQGEVNARKHVGKFLANHRLTAKDNEDFAWWIVEKLIDDGYVKYDADIFGRDMDEQDIKNSHQKNSNGEREGGE